VLYLLAEHVTEGVAFGEANSLAYPLWPQDPAAQLEPLLEPSPVVALARKVYATVRLHGRDYGVDSLCRARQPPTLFSGKVLMERRNTRTRLA